MSSLPKSVVRGAELLDEALPGWEEKIDLEALDMGVCHRCILGQLYGGYDDGLRILEKRVPGAQVYERDDHYGFDTGRLGVHSYERLDEFWSRLIRRRRT